MAAIRQPATRVHFVIVIAFLPSLTAWEGIGPSGWIELERRNRLYCCFLFLEDDVGCVIDSLLFLFIFFYYIEVQTLGK